MTSNTSHNEQEQDIAREYTRAQFSLAPNDVRLRADTREASPMDWANLLSMALKALKRQANFAPISQVILANTPTLILNAQPRAYLIVQNNDTVNTVYFGVGFQPSSTIGIQIPPGGNYEPLVVPQGDIFLSANGNAQITCLYALDYAADANFILPTG